MKIGFTGDICFSGNFSVRLEKNEEVFPKDLLGVLKEEDFIVCNFEGPATVKNNFLRKDIYVVNPPSSIHYLKERNFNIFNLANNHIFDCGPEGFYDTQSILLNNNLHYFGSGANLEKASQVLYLEKAEICIGMIGLCHKEGLIAQKSDPGIFCVDDFELVKERVKEAKSKSDFVVINYHGGEEFSLYPMPSRRKLIKKIASLKPDIIICHHPHVFQGIEKIGQTLVFYSLGNFIFDIEAHNKRTYTNDTAYLSFNFTKESYDYKLIPIKIDVENGQLIKNPDEEFINNVKSISNFHGYYMKWIKESARIYKEEVKKRDDYFKENRIAGKGGLGVRFSLIKSIFKVLGNPIRRQIIGGVLLYKILKSISIIK